MSNETTNHSDLQDDLSMSSVLSAHELERLAKYRAAVEAGFYTDDCAEPVSSEFDLLFFGCAASYSTVDETSA